MMQIQETKLQGIYIIKNKYIEDIRGDFCKIYNEEIYNKYGIDFKFREQYYSTSNKGVIRGMHFQAPPYQHAKLIHVISGKALDVILDIRKESNTYGQYVVIELERNDATSIYIPKGCAHGFQALEDNTIMLYNVETIYNMKADKGIRYDSFGMKWIGERHIISDRDLKLETFRVFMSPF